MLQRLDTVGTIGLMLLDGNTLRWLDISQ